MHKTIAGKTTIERTNHFSGLHIDCVPKKKIIFKLNSKELLAISFKDERWSFDSDSQVSRDDDGAFFYHIWKKDLLVKSCGEFHPNEQTLPQDLALKVHIDSFGQLKYVCGLCCIFSKEVTFISSQLENNDKFPFLLFKDGALNEAFILNKEFNFFSIPTKASDCCQVQ
ncbi:hypothetical protein DID73_00130 [Candidatus Marinamargulisbacteria bacterium SCGC AG-343-K17]|nr:hypothetical protein DID73_00130 [Candidatus Marinamargulisbacteria bacterium SCGC AG-343-K17]